MFVIPPPTGKFYPQLAEQLPRPPMDTHNVLEHLEPEEYQLVVGEGTYNIRESVLVATPPPHPTEPASQPPNPLDTTRKPPRAGATLSLAIVGPKGAAHALQLRQQLLFNTRPATPDSDDSPESSHDTNSQNEFKTTSRGSDYNGSNNRDVPSDTGESSLLAAPVFGHANPALASPVIGKDTKDGAKKKKPKNSMVKTNSSFVARVHPMDSLNKKLSDRDQDGIFAFSNVNRAFHWIDMSTLEKYKGESLTKILFAKAHALCHDINTSTTSQNHIDVIIGFSTADLLWYEPISQKYTRINKNGMINPTAVFDIKWMPGSENLFLAAHDDGTLIVYDKEKEDAPFLSDDNRPASTPNLAHPTLGIRKSVQSSTQRTNPVAYWKVCNQRINAVSFSPDGLYLAVVSGDGRLRVIDFHKEKLIDVYDSYFGELYCVCWSPDGNFILTGGQDDLISIWSFAERRIVARFLGHRAWVRSIAFDPWRCDDRNYRFGSVGDDCMLLLWDFNVGMLHKPRVSASRQRASVSSALLHHNDSLNRMRSESTVSAMSLEEDDVILHPTESKAKTPMLRPLMQKKVDAHPLSWIGFQEDCIIASCRKGHIRVWDRPEDLHAPNDGIQ